MKEEEHSIATGLYEYMVYVKHVVRPTTERLRQCPRHVQCHCADDKEFCWAQITSVNI